MVLLIWKTNIQRTAIKQDGQKAAIEHTGRTGGLPFVGVGWYRTQFNVPELTSDKQVFVQFDGAMSNPEVFVNGQKAGEWHNGYNTFFLDITPYVKANNNTFGSATQQPYPDVALVSRGWFVPQCAYHH